MANSFFKLEHPLEANTHFRHIHKTIDEHLLTRSYISGYQALKDDITVFAALSKPPTSQYVYASCWFNHIDALLRISGVSTEGSGAIVKGSALITEEAVVTPPQLILRMMRLEKSSCSFWGRDYTS